INAGVTVPFVTLLLAVKLEQGLSLVGKLDALLRLMRVEQERRKRQERRRLFTLILGYSFVTGSAMSAWRLRMLYLPAQRETLTRTMYGVGVVSDMVHPVFSVSASTRVLEAMEGFSSPVNKDSAHAKLVEDTIRDFKRSRIRALLGVISFVVMIPI